MREYTHKSHVRSKSDRPVAVAHPQVVHDSHRSTTTTGGRGASPREGAVPPGGRVQHRAETSPRFRIISVSRWSRLPLGDGCSLPTACIRRTSLQRGFCFTRVLLHARAPQMRTAANGRDTRTKCRACSYEVLAGECRVTWPIIRHVGDSLIRFGGGGRNRTGVHGFAGRCITTLPPRRGH
jgi:hypothetical protein